MRRKIVKNLIVEDLKIWKMNSQLSRNYDGMENLIKNMDFYEMNCDSIKNLEKIV